MDKKRAIEILNGLLDRTKDLFSENESAQSLEWAHEAQAAIEHIFDDHKIRVNQLNTKMNIANCDSYWENKESALKERIQSVEAFLRSMIKEIKTYWPDNPPASPQENLPSSAKSVGIQVIEDQRHVFVVHGRNASIRNAVFDFLHAIGLKPLEWSEIVTATGKPSPYIGEVLEKGFSMAQAVVVILTPDDEARLRPELRKEGEPSYESELRGQARPNVLFEAGMAMGLHPNRTVIVEIGNLRPFTDIGGRHVIRLGNSLENRKDLASRLENAGCPVDLSGTGWHTAGSFDFMQKTGGHVLLI